MVVVATNFGWCNNARGESWFRFIRERNRRFESDNQFIPGEIRGSVWRNEINNRYTSALILFLFETIFFIHEIMEKIINKAMYIVCVRRWTKSKEEANPKIEGWKIKFMTAHRSVLEKKGCLILQQGEKVRASRRLFAIKCGVRRAAQNRARGILLREMRQTKFSSVRSRHRCTLLGLRISKTFQRSNLLPRNTVEFFKFRDKTKRIMVIN